MSDQAQGLRVLADQVRSNYSSPLSPPASHLGDSFSPGETNAVVTLRREPNQVFPSEFALTEGYLNGNSLSHRKGAVRILAVTSGSRGVGKSTFSINLSLTLSRLGQRVVLLDANPGPANLRSLLGPAPCSRLEHRMRGEKTLQEALQTGPSGAQWITGGSDITELASLSENRRNAFVTGLRELYHLADVIVMDTGTGKEPDVLAFLCAVEEIIILVTPEPTALTDAYTAIKIVAQENPAARLMLVVNRVNSSGDDAAVASRLVTMSRKFLNIELGYLGCIPNDLAVGRAARLHEPFVLSRPTGAASKSIGQITEKWAAEAK